jgi:hypothetical protein
MNSFFSLISIFPLSFIAYSLSERLIARHESRVGKQISFTGFVWQTWVDTLLEIKSLKPLWVWGVLACQISIVFLYNLDVDYLVFPYLAVNVFLIGWLSPVKGEVEARIDSDRKQTNAVVASGMAALCLLGGFTLSRTANLNALSWSAGHLLFVIPFQLAGMILFEDYPFSSFLERRSWIQSVRFYAWSMLTTKVFLGGGDYFVDFHLKCGAIYIASRLIAIYFPRFRQKDLLRISIFYLFPLTGVIWLLMMLVFALIQSGGVSA